MSGDNIRIIVIRRVLDRGKGVDLLTVGENHDTSRVLAGGTLNPYAALNQTVYLTSPLGNPVFFKIVFNIAVHRLIRQGTYSPGLEGVAFSEDNLCIFVGLGLVLSGEIQVYIRLLVSLETKEGLKRNVEAVFFKLSAADRTVLIGHVAAAHAGIGFYLLGIEIRIVAVGTIIVGT